MSDDALPPSILTLSMKRKLSSLLSDYSEKSELLSGGSLSPAELEKIGKECDHLGRLAGMSESVEVVRESLVDLGGMIREQESENGNGSEDSFLEELKNEVSTLNIRASSGHAKPRYVTSRRVSNPGII